MSEQNDATVASSDQVPTIIEILIDETGSMTQVTASTIDAFNNFIMDQKEGDTPCQVTMTKFSSSKVSTPYEMIPVAMVPKLTRATFIPSGGTNLYDVMLSRAKILMETIGQTPCNVIFLVLTDGDDNVSAPGSEDRVRAMLPERMGAGWTFVYLGAHERAVATALRLGFPDNNVKQFEKSDAEMASAMAQTSAATSAYRLARASGSIAVGTSSVSYFSGE